MRSTLPTVPVPETLELIKSLQKDHKAYAVGNVPAPVFQLLRADCNRVESLDKVFLSSQNGVRMLHLGFFNAVLDFEPLNVGRTLIVSSNLDRVVAARSLGYYATVSTQIYKNITLVKAMCKDLISYAL